MRPLILGILILVLSSCSSSLPIKRDVVVSPVVSGNVIDAVKLRSGGTLGLVRFKAGPQAEDNEQLDVLSAALVKGAAERIGERKTVLIIGNKSSNVDLVLDGYIEEFSEPIKTMFMSGKKNRVLSISGEIWRKDSGAKVMTFASSLSEEPSKGDPTEMAHQMGRAIGDYIASQTAKE